MIARLLTFIGATWILWLLLGLPFRFLNEDRAYGDAMMIYGGVAALICLIPGSLTLWWGSRPNIQPREQVLVMFGSTGLRIMGVFGLGILLFFTVPYLRVHRGFWLWVLVFYLFTLALEMMLIVRSRPATNP